MRGRESCVGWVSGWADGPPVPPQRQPVQMSFRKRGFRFHANVCGCDKYTTGRRNYDVKAKSVLQKMHPGVRGASESRVGHLSETVWEADGALRRSTEQV